MAAATASVAAAAAAAPKLRVGCIGLGIMGKAIARNILVKGGFPLTVWNRTAAKADDLVALGATAAASPRQVAEQCDVVFTNLSDSPDVEEIVLDATRGVLAGAKPGLIVVDNSTIKPSSAKHIAAVCAKQGVAFLDAPVSGGDVGAQNGTLAVMVGGDDAALERVLPVLQAMSKSVTLVGPSGAGQVTKAANQIMVAAQMVAQAELLVFAQKAGVDPQRVVNAIKGGAAACWTLDVKPPRIFAGNRGPGFRAEHQAKDLKIVMDSAAEFGVSLPTTAVNTQLFQAMLAHGEGQLDNSAVLNVLERANATRVGPQP
jgi:2-hydroxy-3-oxopropionate reductase